MRLLAWFLALLAGAFLVNPVETGQIRAAASVPAPAPAPAPVTAAVAAPTSALPRARISGPPRVAVIDSGIARTVELRASVVSEFDLGAVPARPPFRPRDHHGTMVATILQREARQPIEIISLRVDDPAGCPPGHMPPCQPNAEPLARAIRKAADLDVSAINISLNLKDDPAIVDAVRAAAERGIPVVLAAGNEGRDRPGNLKMARAAYPHAVLVGALEADGRPWAGTNRPHPDTPGYLYTWQPGVGIPTALADGAKVLATGTSFAAPIETARLLHRRQTGLVAATTPSPDDL